MVHGTLDKRSEKMHKTETWLLCITFRTLTSISNKDLDENGGKRRVYKVKYRGFASLFKSPVERDLCSTGTTNQDTVWEVHCCRV